MMSRREWLRSIGAATSGLAVTHSLAGQQPTPRLADTSNLFVMDQAAAQSVRLPAKPGATRQMTPDQRDALEHKIRCQCGCTLDVYTCRTTDFSCQVSPAMHRDVMALVDGGYTAQEILDAFTNVYGERVLMAPPRVGFNIVGYVLPGIAVAVGAVILAVMLRRWKHATPDSARVSAARLDGTPEEVARLDAAIRDDS